jgi:hypothetical protein
LKLSLIFEALILGLYVPLNFRDVFLSFALSILSEILKELGVLLLYSLLLSFKVLASLLFNLTQLRKKCLVALLFVFKFLFFYHTGVFELQQLLLCGFQVRNLF